METRVRHPSASDVDRYVIITKLFDSIFNNIPVFMGNSDMHKQGIFFRKVAYTMYDVAWFVEQTDYNHLHTQDISALKMEAYVAPKLW
jgi:hypothetical protein